MKTGVLGLLLATSMVLAGCGDEAKDATDTPRESPTYRGCAGPADPPPVAQVDLDGDGPAEPITYAPADGSCPAMLSATVGGHELSVDLDDELPVTPADVHAIAVPGRTGQVLLVQPQHPRGGFQARLCGYADGKLEELEAEGKPIFDFVATDTLTSPIAASCVADGFDVRQAKAHEPAGVVPAWDVYRTTYTVDGNTVTKGETTEVADNVLDRQLQHEYGALTGYDLFGDCLADG